MQLSKRVRELREQRGLTQKELAEQLSVSPTYDIKVESEVDADEFLPSPYNVRKALRKRIRERP